MPDAHYYEKWVHYYEKNLLGMIAISEERRTKDRSSVTWSPGKWSGMYRTGKHTRKTITYNNKHMAKFELSNEVKPLDRIISGWPENAATKSSRCSMTCCGISYTDSHRVLHP